VGLKRRHLGVVLLTMKPWHERADRLQANLFFIERLFAK